MSIVRALAALSRRTLCTAAEAATLPAADRERALQSIARGEAPATGRSYAAIAAEVFGHVPPGTPAPRRSGRKLLKKRLKGDLLVNWYLEPSEKNPYNPMKMTQQQERWRAKLAVMRMQGRGPPKKGQGKKRK